MEYLHVALRPVIKVPLLFTRSEVNMLHLIFCLSDFEWILEVRSVWLSNLVSLNATQQLDSRWLCDLSELSVRCNIHLKDVTPNHWKLHTVCPLADICMQSILCAEDSFTCTGISRFLFKSPKTEQADLIRAGIFLSTPLLPPPAFDAIYFALIMKISNWVLN